MEVRNRMVFSAHGTCLGAHHRPTPELAAYHAARARGGIGLIVLENSRVHPTGRGPDAALEAWNEDNIPHYRSVADAVHEQGARIFAQLHHPGRNANSTDSLLAAWAPSALHLPWSAPTGSHEVPHAMTKEEIAEVIRWWARSAANMKRAGMDGVEIHGAHGFLICQFLSPVTNRRTDEYGGSLRNRARFAMEVARAVRQAVADEFVVGMRLSADELLPEGLTLEQTTEVARWLEESGALDYLSISHSVEYVPSSLAQQIADMSWGQAPFVHLAAGIKKATREIPIFTVCRIIDPAMADSIIAAGKADMVIMTRAHIADPEIGRKLVEGHPEDIRQCIGCNQGCVARALSGKPIGCLINPEAGRERELGSLVPAERRKAVVVIGGGPAGMEAARVAALRGHLVALYERGERLGGQITTLVKAPHRQEFGNIVAWLEDQLKRLGVVVKLNTEATPERIQKEGADTVIVATGSTPEPPEIPGTREPGSPVLATAEDVLERRVPVGHQVVLLDGVGHHKATSTAEFLAEQGSRVHLVTQAGTVAAEIHPVSRAPALQRLKDRRVAFHRDCWIKEVVGRTAVLRDVYNGDEEAIEGVDLVVAATPNRSCTELYDTLRQEDGIPEVLAVGDCVAPRRALEAIREGHMAGRAL
ncbi:MAG: FAD-dependent oxidoreductase [Candidatus Rokubacteria bacterium]|nr:FAD-dependent oxidoreductase [Candidatus Rokubacteria bacterium]